MPTLAIGDQKVTVGEDFMRLPPEQQHATVDEIAKSLPGGGLSTPQGKGEADKLSWAGVPGEALSNIPASAGRFAKNVVQPFIHPIDTAKNIGRLGAGVLEKTGLKASAGHEKYADAAFQALKARYGGTEQLKKTIAEDPVGFVADLSMFFSAGETALARFPGAIGETAQAAGQVGRALNPLTLPMKAVEKSGDITAQVIGNLGTHSGAEGLKQAYASGKEGGAAGAAFRANMRDPEVHQSALVTAARKALGAVQQERGVAYQKGMQAIGQNNKILDFGDIDKAMSQANLISTFKGVNIGKLAGVTKPLPAEAVRLQLQNAIDAWKKLDPANFHTPAGLDALKKYVGEVKDSLAYGTPERKAAEEVYGAIRGTIIKQAPDYAKVMKDYEQASDLLGELTKTLSLGKKVSEDTTLRKLLSTTRSNVNTNFGKRASLAKELGRKDPTLLPALAGQSVAQWTPGGLGKLTAGVLGGEAAFRNPLAAAALPFMSPRLMGEAAHGFGRAVGKVPLNIRDATGRINPELLKRILLQAQLAGRNPGGGGQ